MNDEEIAYYKTKIDSHFDSEELRAVVLLAVLRPNLLSKRGQSMGSLGIKRLVDNGVELPAEKEAKQRAKAKAKVRRHVLKVIEKHKDVFDGLAKYDKEQKEGQNEK